MNQKGEIIQTENTLINANTGTVPSPLHFLIQTQTEGQEGKPQSRVSVELILPGSVPVTVFITCSFSELSTASSEPVSVGFWEVMHLSNLVLGNAPL